MQAFMAFQPAGEWWLQSNMAGRDEGESPMQAVQADDPAVSYAMQACMVPYPDCGWFM
jgi:hypothetical protein